MISLDTTFALAPGLRIIAIDDLPSTADASAATTRTPAIVDVTSTAPAITRSGVPTGGAMVVG
ncbi:hypothetical protein BE21_03910 [Sorangium cellulosum]|uniref:Uncharacterized protein n=1 Tax=Sorangium cellulosum TaxID=56 RepID=A0A150TIK4_SORCE|nr:hypothetical protein BE21_03910 [Sorangium cellulosum]